MIFPFYVQLIAGQSWISACMMSVIIGSTFLVGSCVGYKLHSCAIVKEYTAETKNYKKILYGALSLMAISLYAISGDVHYSKSSSPALIGLPQNPPDIGHEAILYDKNIRKKAVAVALFCIFMMIYSVGVRPIVSVLEGRLIGHRTNGIGTIMYTAISTTTHWLAVSVIIHLLLINWSHIGFGWISVSFATVCLLTILYVSVFIPDSVNDVTAANEDDDPNVIQRAVDEGQAEIAL